MALPMFGHYKHFYPVHPEACFYCNAHEGDVSSDPAKWKRVLLLLLLQPKIYKPQWQRFFLWLKMICRHVCAPHPLQALMPFFFLLRASLPSLLPQCRFHGFVYSETFLLAPIDAKGRVTYKYRCRKKNDQHWFHFKRKQIKFCIKLLK